MNLGPLSQMILLKNHLSQEIDRGDEDKPLAPKDGGKSTVKTDTSPIVKTYPKRTTKNKPPQWYGWSLNPLTSYLDMKLHFFFYFGMSGRIM